MKKILLLLFIALVTTPLCKAQVAWMSDLTEAKNASKLFNKPILIWVGVPGFKTRPLELSEKRFEEVSKKIICLNLDPRHMSDEERETYDVSDSNVNRIYYYDIDFNLLHSEGSPPAGLLGGVHIMLKSVEAKKEKEKEAKENKKEDDESDKLWKEILSLEVNERYEAMIPKLKLMSSKFPNSAYSEQAKAKLEKIEKDPVITSAIKSQREEAAAAKLYRTAEIFLDNKKKTEAKAKLEELLQKHPNSKVARDAKELLDKIK